MVINEKGLTRAMKEAYRTTGYKVAVQMEHMPRKALGIIWKCVPVLPWRATIEEAQEDLDAYARRKGWAVWEG